MEYRIAFVDFESVKLASGRALVHNISVCTGTFRARKEWVSNGREQSPVYVNETDTQLGPRLDILIGNSLKNPAIELSDNIQKKLARTTVKGEELGYELVRFDTLKESLAYMLKFMKQHTDGILMSHALDRDLQFLVDTADILGEKKIFKKDFMFRPESRCYLSGWNKLTLVCTQRLLTTMCPKFDKMVGSPSQTLESYAKFVFGPSYMQGHTSVEDAIDLFVVMRRAFECDRFHIDRGQTRIFMKPLFRNPAQTSATFPRDLPKS